MDSLQDHPPNDASLPSSVPHDDTLDPHSDEASDSEYDDSSDSNWSWCSPLRAPEYQDDLIYAAPAPSEAAQSKDTKRARLKRRADMAAEAKRVQDERNSAPSFVNRLQGVMEEIEESERTQSQAKETCASKPKKKARKASSA
ncbi:unnamed protein product [Phytophthora fragariaefolia]|uniref:Unnamed protein product n=1 Tax=Phytophthora fragariaefolia TaxID=1490495 RepID=A0A9W6U5I6_9STRA|nr:unnamed protein product [Phytophthora fragariaefolia]